jgi:hypothetical protein
MVKYLLGQEEGTLGHDCIEETNFYVNISNKKYEYETCFISIVRSQIGRRELNRRYCKYKTAIKNFTTPESFMPERAPLFAATISIRGNFLKAFKI